MVWLFHGACNSILCTAIWSANVVLFFDEMSFCFFYFGAVVHCSVRINDNLTNTCNSILCAHTAMKIEFFQQNVKSMIFIAASSWLISKKLVDILQVNEEKPVETPNILLFNQNNHISEGIGHGEVYRKQN